ncbi:hypothetical protein GCM10011613_33160 [Cellvibrio zantedeschiae]|uniref:Uncharacterized protein n=2 Tax=Cellvibrio zantedeschiae TaxID=1237077 RepID=A0ABQ3B990_9GAMM|nr:hypothetical protein GCM10011613_33160 [Cellvibrio zantedeschiae]
MQENIYASISKLGIATSNIEKSAYQLYVSSVKESGVEKISLVLSKGGKALNTRTISTRQNYRGEGYLLESEFSSSAIINYIFGYTFWVPIFESLFDQSPKSEIFYSALESMLVVENEQILSKEAVAIFVPSSSIDHLSLLEPARSGKQIGCDSEKISLDSIDWSKHVLVVRGNRIPVSVGNTFESIVCANGTIYVISTPSNYENSFEVYEFSSEGVPIAHAKYRIDPVEWKGYPRKPLVYFQKNGDSLSLGVLDINEERTINKLYFYNIKVPSSI